MLMLILLLKENDFGIALFTLRTFSRHVAKKLNKKPYSNTTFINFIFSYILRFYIFLNTIEALCPPKPKELLMAYSIL